MNIDVYRSPSLEDLRKHAERFGGASVLDTAIELGFGEAELIEVIEMLDTVVALQYADPATRRRLGLRPPSASRLSVEERVDRARQDNIVHIELERNHESV